MCLQAYQFCKRNADSVVKEIFNEYLHMCSSLGIFSWITSLSIDGFEGLRISSERLKVIWVITHTHV